MQHCEWADTYENSLVDSYCQPSVLSGCTSAEGNTSILITGSAKTLRGEIRDGKASSALIVSALLSRKGFWLTDILSRAGTDLAHHLQCSQFLHFWHMPGFGVLKMGHDHTFKSSALFLGAF